MQDGRFENILHHCFVAYWQINHHRKVLSESYYRESNRTTALNVQCVVLRTSIGEIRQKLENQMNFLHVSLQRLQKLPSPF